MPAGARPIAGFAAVGSCAPAVRRPALPLWRAMSMSASWSRLCCCGRPGEFEPARIARTVWSRPGIATIGAWLAAADETPGRLRVLRCPSRRPPALAAGESEGFVKIVTDAKGRILNVTIAGDGAGE